MQTNVITSVPSCIFTDISGQILPAKQIVVDIAAGAANQQIIAAVTGKKLRILGLTAHPVTDNTIVKFVDGSGGLKLISFRLLNAFPNEVFEFKPEGWFDTSAGVGLYANNKATSIATVSLRYVEYTETA